MSYGAWTFGAKPDYGYKAEAHCVLCDKKMVKVFGQ